MDTNPYSNIMKALGASTTPANGNNTNGGLSYEQQAQNYNTFSELMKQGVSLPDLISKIETLESKVKTMETKSEHDDNEDIFLVMEGSVRNNPDVKLARQKMSDVKSMIIAEMCMKDPRYSDAFSEYRTVVKKEYVKLKEGQQIVNNEKE